jgi:hypothetical protein
MQEAPANRRTGDRRHEATGVVGGPERRRGDRRNRIARAGLVAALAMLGARIHRGQGDAPFAPMQEGSVEVETGDFRLPQYDRAAIDQVIQEAAAIHGVSPDLVRAVVQTESRFDPMAVSPVGAQGLMQLMPTTARQVGITNPFDPRQNVLGGTKYLSMLLDRFNGNVALALAGYNAGPGNVSKHRGIPPFRETRGYVTKIRNIVLESTGQTFSMPAPPRVRHARSSRPIRMAWKGTVRGGSHGKSARATASRASHVKSAPARGRATRHTVAKRTTAKRTVARRAHR